MTEKNVELQKKLSQILSRLTKNQLRFIVALQEHSSKDEAAKAIGVKLPTVYNWPEEVDEAARLMAEDVVLATIELRKRNLIKAMGVKAAGLDSKDERVRQNVATEIIEWETGKAPQSVALTGAGGKDLIPERDKEADARHDRAISSLADALRESLSGKSAEPDGAVDTTK